MVITCKHIGDVKENIIYMISLIFTIENACNSDTDIDFGSITFALEGGNDITISSSGKTYPVYESSNYNNGIAGYWDYTAH